jgi:hypothetical protein
MYPGVTASQRPPFENTAAATHGNDQLDLDLLFLEFQAPLYVSDHKGKRQEHGRETRRRGSQVQLPYI